MAHATSELVCLKNLLRELEIQNLHPMDLICDNQTTIYIAFNLVFINKQNILKLIVILCVRNFLHNITQTKYVKSVD